MSGRRPNAPRNFKVLVVWRDGYQELVQEGAASGKDAVFHTREEAEAMRAFLRAGMDDDEVQNVSVVAASE